MTSTNEIDRLAERFEILQKETLAVFGQLKRAREALGRIGERLPEATEALSSMEEATQRAAHNLLGLLEGAQEVDELVLQRLQVLEGSVRSEHRDAIKSLVDAHGERARLFNEMMTELSFQDLTCQTLKRVVGGLGEVEQAITYALDPSAEAPWEGEQEELSGSMSGLRRLVETQQGLSGQDLVDQLLKG